MKIIKSELNKVEKLIDQINGEVFLDRKYKNDLEWWILGRITSLLRGKGVDSPVYAEKRDPPDPDFFTYSKRKKLFHPIEITEVIDSNRKRSKEYANKIYRKNHSEPNLVLWNSLKNRLNDKFLKFYGKDCWLLIYFDIIYGHISLFGYWDRAILNHITSWNNNKEINLKSSPYEKIYITNSSATALVQIFPKLITVIPENIKVA